MKVIRLEKARKVFGLQVKTFPEKVGEAFDILSKQIPNGLERSYYGISWIEGTTIVYYAAAEQKEEGEAAKYNAREFTIDSGNYLCEELFEWMKKTESIKDIFERMMSDPRVDKTKPAVEWYKSDQEMWCMIKILD